MKNKAQQDYEDCINYSKKIYVRYHVEKDLQGGEFGMYRDYTVEQWRMQAMDWAYIDDNKDLAISLLKLKDDEVLHFIAELWGLKFRATKWNKHISQDDIDAFADVTPKQYFDKLFGSED